ncbi:MAG: FixH family protein [Gammaproteobacteria bacterium]
MKTLTIIFVSLILCTTTFAETNLATSKLSDHKHFIVSYTSKLDPIEINNLHTWIIHIKDMDNKDVVDAELTVIGGMPEHNHGLPTQPKITMILGDGYYLLEGMKFHMMGWWTVTISITSEKASDTVTFNLNL